MQNPLNRVAVIMLFALLVPLVGYGQQVPSVIPYQGSLANQGSPASGTFILTFALYDSPTGGQSLWTETREVEVTDGRFSVQLGTQTALPSAVFEGAGEGSEGTTRYLEVQVQGEDAFPRVPLGSAPFALRARLAEGVVPGVVDAAALAEDAAVLSLNEGVGALTLEGANGATVNRDGSVITISAPGGDGASGILGVQNSDGTLSIQDPNGPTATIDILDNGITTAKLADNAVTSANIADGTITGSDIGEGTIGEINLTSGAAVRSLSVGDEALTGGVTLTTSGSASLSLDGNTITIGAAAGGLTSVTTNGTLTGAGTDDSALGIADEGVNTPQLAPEAVTSSIIANGGVQAADLANGGVTGIKIADGALVGDGNIDVSRNDDDALEITFTGELGGGVTSVSGGAGIDDGGQTTGDVELSIGNGNIVGSMLNGNAIQDGANINVSRDDDNNFVIAAPNALTNAVTNLNGLAGGVSLVEGDNVSITDNGSDQITISAMAPEGGLTSVASDGTLTGDGTSDSPLGIANNGVGTQQLAGDAVASAQIADGSVQANDLAADAAVASLNGLAGSVSLVEGDNVSITDNGSDQITISATAPEGGLTSVASDGTLTGDGTSDSPLGIANSAVGTPQLAENAVNSAIVLDNSLTADDLATNSVEADELANGAVDGPAILSGAVNVAKLNTSNNPAPGDFLSYNGSQLEWQDSGFSNSSIRWKENVRTLQDPVGLVERLRGVRYDWKEDGTADVGVIAEEVAEVLPEVVAFEADGRARGVNYGKLVSVLIEATKTQQQTIESKEQTIERQQGEIDALKERMNRLERLVEQLDRDR